MQLPCRWDTGWYEEGKKQRWRLSFWPEWFHLLREELLGGMGRKRRGNQKLFFSMSNLICLLDIQVEMLKMKLGPWIWSLGITDKQMGLKEASSKEHNPTPPKWGSRMEAEQRREGVTKVWERVVRKENHENKVFWKPRGKEGRIKWEGVISVLTVPVRTER